MFTARYVGDIWGAVYIFLRYLQYICYLLCDTQVLSETAEWYLRHRHLISHKICPVPLCVVIAPFFLALIIFFLKKLRDTWNYPRKYLQKNCYIKQRISQDNCNTLRQLNDFSDIDTWNNYGILEKKPKIPTKNWYIKQRISQDNL